MDTIETVWKQVKAQIKKSIPEHSYRMWIDPVEFVADDENHVCLSVPNNFFAKRLQENYLETIENEFVKLGCEFKIKFVTEVNSSTQIVKAEDAILKETSKKQIASKKKPQKNCQAKLPGFERSWKSGRIMQEGFTFDDFVVGDNSNFAYSALRSLAEGNINETNIFYLLGKTGLGKSHLSQATGHYIINHTPTAKVYYVTAEDFTNEMIYSLKNGSIELFKKKYRTNCDVLILEDIHFLAGKLATQKELAITLDYLLDADKKIIFSGYERPDDIPKLNDRLKSRLSMGLITEIEKPDFRTRLNILNKKAKNLKCFIPVEVMELIAQELFDDVRQLQSGLLSVVLKSNLLNQKIDVSLAKSILANMVQARKQISIDLIKGLVCNAFSISQTEIISSSRKQKIVKPRQVAMFLARKYTDIPIKRIGSSFKKYHATALYSINAVEKELNQKGLIYEQVNYLSKKIETGIF